MNVILAMMFPSYQGIDIGPSLGAFTGIEPGIEGAHPASRNLGEGCPPRFAFIVFHIVHVRVASGVVFPKDLLRAFLGPFVMGILHNEHENVGDISGL